MEKQIPVPAVIHEWPSRVVPHPGGEHIDFHYHDVEEWLQVLEGEISFFIAGERDYRLATGDTLRILPGEVHRVEIGAAGVTYRMWTPVAQSADTFAHKVSAEQMLLINKNLELPEVENQWEERDRSQPTVEDLEVRGFLTSLLSENLTFRTARGTFLGREHYLTRAAANVVRSSSGSVQILHSTPDSLLLLTVVDTQQADGSQGSFANIRLFVKYSGVWQCSVWLNYPEP